MSNDSIQKVIEEMRAGRSDRRVPSAVALVLWENSAKDWSDRLSALAAQQPQPNPGTTHWDGCWRDHLACAVARIEAQQPQQGYATGRNAEQHAAYERHLAASPSAPAQATAQETCLCPVYEDHGPVSELNPDCPIHGHDAQDQSAPAAQPADVEALRRDAEIVYATMCELQKRLEEETGVRHTWADVPIQIAERAAITAASGEPK